MDQSDLDLVQSAPAYHLQAVAKMRHIPLSPVALSGSPSGVASSQSLSSATILDIARHLFDASSLLSVFEQLEEVPAAILRELVECGGRANSRDLAFYFTSGGLLSSAKKAEPAPVASHETARPPAPGPAMPLQPPQYPPIHPHGIFEQSVRHLSLLGLLFWGKQTNFAGRDYTSGIHDGVLIVPHAVSEVARDYWPPTGEQGQTDLEVGERVRAFQRTLYLYWSQVAAMREGLPLVNNGLLARAPLRHMAEQMGELRHGEQVRLENEFPRLLFIRLLLMKLGLLREGRSTLYALPADAFFALPLIERARRCYRLYLESPFWNEMLYLPEVNVRPGPLVLDPAHEEVVHSRRIVIERLLREPTGVWDDLTAFIARTKIHVPYLLFPRQQGPRAERYSGGSNIYGWDFRLRRGWLTHREGWHMVEGGFIRAIIGGPLFWLGLLDLDREVLPASFCLSPHARLSMRDEAVEVAESWGRLIVQPNFELVALAPVSEALLVGLDRFADRVSLEHIAQYRLSRASVTRAIQHGLHAEEIQASLEQAAGGEIPQNVRYSLGEWERQARRVEIWPDMTLMEVDDESWLDTLLADESTRALFGRRLTPRLIEVASHRLQAVQDLLWQRSYLPALTPARDDSDQELKAHEPQWRLHDDGLLQPFYAVQDLYRVAEVERFCERDAATAWYCITSASLQQALEQGLTLPAILRFLQQHCEGGIPPSLLIRLKLWGGGYGAGHALSVEQAPLLRLTPDVLHDLRSDSELAELLGAEVEQQSRLVHLAPQHVDRVRELLRERGFLVD